MRVAFLLTALVFATNAQAEDPAVQAARGVIERTIGRDARAVELELTPRSDPGDAFEYEAQGGTLKVRGTSAVAITRGFYEYLRSACSLQVTWDVPRVTPPASWPDSPLVRGGTSHRYRHYFNVCTFGYTMTWWDWPRWEQEIDWMALHGINMPLAQTGTEGVWRRVWREFGLSDADLDSFFTGPAYLPWHRMGNINGHAGPLPSAWHDQQAALQKRILERERALGMTPVMSAFSGFVPPALMRLHPDAKVTRSALWGGFTDPTYLLNPRDPLFEQIGRRFVEELTREFGTDHLYLADVFNEMPPQVAAETKYDDLNAIGEAVFRSITAGDPRGVWVMQGWLFLNERNFWGQREVEAFLNPVPDDRMILLDLALDHMEVWRAHAAFRRKGWIGCILHNFGQNTPLCGDLRQYAARLADAARDPNHGNLLGLGLTMEGIEQNPVVYELVTDAMWRSEPIAVERWLDDYVRTRYGRDCPAAREAWQSLLLLVYNGHDDFVHYTHRPSLGPIGDPPSDFVPLREAALSLLKCSPDLDRSAAYQRDLVDVTKRYLERAGRALLLRAALAYDRHDAAAIRDIGGRYLELLGDIDRLVGTQSQHRLSTWLDAARRCADTPELARLYERNARMQVTVWGGPGLHDYARKEWSGLIAGFYVQRWRMFLDALADAAEKGTFDDSAVRQRIADWEWAWTERTDNVPTPANHDAVALTRDLLARYADTGRLLLDRGIAVGKPATDSGGTEGAHKPALAVDGWASGSFWAASPWPQWWQVDLEQVERIGGLHVFCDSDGTRYYQYTVDVSTDGRQWRRVVDRSDNTRPEPARGEQHRFDPVDARFVRVTMLKNSANAGVHLREVSVYRAE